MEIEKSGISNNVFCKEYNSFKRIIIKTHFVNIGESYIELVSKYVLPHFEQGDVLFISEKIISMCQKNIVNKKDVKLGFFAKFLSKFATSSSAGIGMDEPYKLQLAINLAGLPLVLFACFCSVIAKIFKKRGVFYKIVDHGVSEIDGFYSHSAFELYHDIAILSPIEPSKVCDEIYEKFKIKAVIVDANDFGVKILGKSKILESYDDLKLISLIKDNPAGQDDELTPFVLVKHFEN
ncbi:MAG: F420-0--gamma-glutamyl ligase [Clostridia bacterium]|nr:F420-0--gamma-glutamyl ligase [Clostridia bacterium]